MSAAFLTALVRYLVSINATLPVIVDTVAAVSLVIKGAAGSGPTVLERAEVIRSVVAGNDAYGEAEIARLVGLASAQD